ncbi:G patch domain-containing protein 4 [Lepisosteus oculatus]|uniref:G patch domain-containing protein 4 n=1 Tax=Lepisosteus oculatus TaxID=7918 RepID=UPI00371616E6
MADAAEDKSRGLKFAERQLLRHGWQQGKGLGKRENGISEAIKVKVKCDKTGVGHSPGEEFTFHWWDHVFNKAAAGLSVESSKDGVTVQKLLEEEGPVSNKKPRKAELSRAKLYGRFIKSATLLSGEEQPEEKPGSSADSSDSEDEDRRLDLSSTTKLSDDDLIKVCGGRTAHKGARHGFKMSAKLARLEQQEREFLEKYGKKSQPGGSDASPASRGQQHQQQQQQEEEEEGRTGKRKKKKKKQQQRLEEREALMEEEGHCSETGASGQQDLPRKKKKKGKRGRSEAILEQEQGNGAGEEEEEEEEGRKKRKSNKKCRQEPEEEQAEDSERSRKKKKKKKKAQDE